MDKLNIKIPRGIQYISEWTEYSLPRGKHCIINKGVTGCGYTEFCLRNKDNVILCSPRKLLLENKSEQYRNDNNIFYLINDIQENDDKEKKIKEFKENIKSHHNKCVRLGKPVKFMVTYDSLHYISTTLRSLTDDGFYNFLDDYIIVIDEFQSIFIDSYYKAEVEINVVTELQRCKNVIYLSATPMLDKYLEKLEEFKNLKYYSLDWSETGYVEKIFIKRKRVDSLSTECCKIINNYKNGLYPKSLNREGKVLESKEAVFYFNSVIDIARVLKKSGLTPKEVLVICSDTKENRKRLKIKDSTGKILYRFIPNKVPLPGEERMFTFCTSCIYMGIDFYSTCASSYIFADPNIDCLALDISLDLPQIVGRQRNKNNPFKNNFSLYYKIRRKDDIRNLTYEDFLKVQNKRRVNTTELLKLFHQASDSQKEILRYKLIQDISYSKYSQDFISFSVYTNEPVWNNLIEVASERAWEVSQKEYQDEINVTRSLEEAKFGVEIEKEQYEKIVNDFLENEFYNTGIFSEKMKSYCKFRDLYEGNENIINLLSERIKDQKYNDYYRYFGTSRCSALKYNESMLFLKLIPEEKEKLLVSEISINFSLGESYTNKHIKEILSRIYKKLSIPKTAKATDLKSYFNLVLTKIYDESSNKRIDGYKLISML